MTSQPPFYQRIAQPFLRMMQGTRSRDRLALVLRLENVELLTEYLGHAGFAHLLVQLSMRMTRAVRPNDPVQIAAPGIFTVLLHTRSEVEAMRIAQRLQAGCQQPVQANGRVVTPVLTGVLIENTGAGHVASHDMIGFARDRLSETTPEELGRIVLIPHDYHWRRPSQPSTIAEAVAEGQIEAYFQPQVCCNSGRITGFEALARWNHPSRGLLGPAAFMAGMNDLDHAALTHQILRQALTALRRWDAEGLDVPSVALNVSSSALSDTGFADMVFWELDRQEIAPSRLVLELLESIGPINSCERTRENLARLAEAGCCIDMDDFGTGYASLGSIRHFGVHRIKIDRSFVAECHADPAQQRMILAILALAERLGIATLAEGVETPEEHSFLAQIGVDQVQGYVIGRPMSVDRCSEFIAGYQIKQGEISDLLQRRA
ncbi:MAG: EAL domain-containing protein [Paracoccus sp. (in: a-proteobacteria)]|uniref:EAL domain-containing protein n=1 Tax=Paracoccus sp. TaxID=267 RepID=UPI0026DF35B2|nr:EAL domain-containing protein [Paracoccus sp. (in: a-proteobacteria)]MDO5613615.1 EAL domain-containing protein [Paracoccus sp. (in: a-proteobacteria)]